MDAARNSLAFASAGAGGEITQPLPAGTVAWVSDGRYVALLEFLPALGAGGFYSCAILMRDPADGTVLDLVPRSFITLSPPWSDHDAR
jgi:hypothetical protein